MRHALQSNKYDNRHAFSGEYATKEYHLNYNLRGFDFSQT